MQVNRILLPTIKQALEDGKVILVVGPRQVGKTTLLKMVTEQIQQKFLWLDCDEPDVRELLTNVSSTALKNLIGDARLVIIDEAQRVKNIGLTLKLITDKISNVKLLVSGSSSLELANEIKEPLTGRKREFMLLPFSTEEMIRHTSLLEEKRLLEQRMIFGMYPEVVKQPSRSKEILRELSESYLYKDIFTFQDIRKPEVVHKLLQALSLQVGSEVSFHELARLSGSDQATVQRYLDLLEKAFVIFRLPAFSRNLRTELKKSRKFYFYDNGIRNALINQFQPLATRPDIGALWENFLVSERTKYLANHQLHPNQYFWRTVKQQEIDYLEDEDGKIMAYAFTWNPNVKPRFPKPFLEAYREVETKVVSPDNYLDFIAG